MGQAFEEMLDKEAEQSGLPQLAHPLHAVFRVKKLKGVPAVLKKILFDLDLYEKVA